MKVLVTGGAGYIGCQLVYELSKNDNISQIIVYDNLSRGNHNLFISKNNRIEGAKVKFVLGDLLDSRKIKSTLKGVEIVYHLAAKVATPYSNVDSHAYEQNNNWGTSELIAAAEEVGTVKKFFYLSSTGVYGSSKEIITSVDNPNPRTVYGTSKLRGESHVERINGNMETMILRCGNVYGYSPCIRFDSVINKFLFEAHYNNRISIHGSGKQSRSFIHVDKVVAALVQLTNSPAPSGTYNLTDKNYILLDLVDVFKELYPELEFIFINQHLALRELQVAPDERLSNYISLGDSDLKEELTKVKEQYFAFGYNSLVLQ
ncbi:MAG: NAD-dependent epimerase/dehydratase family protein [Cyclobacteriaceae bacterium]